MNIVKSCKIVERRCAKMRILKLFLDLIFVRRKNQRYHFFGVIREHLMICSFRSSNTGSEMNVEVDDLVSMMILVLSVSRVVNKCILLLESDECK